MGGVESRRLFEEALFLGGIRVIGLSQCLFQQSARSPQHSFGFVLKRFFEGLSPSCKVTFLVRDFPAAGEWTLPDGCFSLCQTDTCWSSSHTLGVASSFMAQQSLAPVLSCSASSPLYRLKSRHLLRASSHDTRYSAQSLNAVLVFLFLVDLTRAGPPVNFVVVKAYNLELGKGFVKSNAFR